MMERLFCDLHIHSCLSPCGDALMTPNNIAGMAFIKGLDVIAVCDHNSARNLPAVKAAADRMNVLLLPGMELTTREEAHMLCYFRTVQACMAFGEAIYAHLAPTPNNERFFGRQQVMNERDEEIDVEERLLIGALDLPFEACAARIREAGGLCVPAHINRGNSGVLGALGFLPQGVHYDALEVSPAAPLTADVTGIDPAAALRAILTEEHRRDVCRVTLTGERGEESLDLPALEGELADLCFGLTLRDRTRVSRDLWARGEDDGLVGLFLQEMKARLAQEPDNELLPQAVRFGMAALEGWEEIT